MKCNDNLLDINGNLLVEVIDGINVYHYLYVADLMAFAQYFY